MNLKTPSLRTWEVNVDAIELGDKIGEGSFGDVYRATMHGMEVAVKKIKEGLISPKEKEQATSMLRHEVKTLSRCRHKNVVQLLGVCTEPAMLVLDYAAQGTLRILLRDHYDDLLPSRKIELLHGICDGLAMLHSQNVLHLDLKPENVLISEDGTPWVADFGLAIALTATLTAGAASTKGGRGTIQYKAPEHFANDESDSDDSEDAETKGERTSIYQKPADVYSFGMICWEMFSGQVPFAGKEIGRIVSMHIKAALNAKKNQATLVGRHSSRHDTTDSSVLGTRSRFSSHVFRGERHVH